MHAACCCTHSQLEGSQFGLGPVVLAALVKLLRLNVVRRGGSGREYELRHYLHSRLMVGLHNKPAQRLECTKEKKRKEKRRKQ